MRMKTLFLSLCLLGATFTTAQTTPPTKDSMAGMHTEPAKAAPTMTVAQILDRQLSNRENEVVPAADAMPEEKFDFAPGDLIKTGEFKGVKTYAQQVRHIAATNELIAASLMGQPS